MRQLLSWSIRKHIFILIAVMTVVPVGIILFSAHRQRGEDVREARLLAERLAEDLSVDQKMLVSGAEQLLSTLSQIPAVQKHDAKAVNSFLAGLVRNNPQFSNLLIVDNTGLMWAGAIPVHGPMLVADRRYFRNLMATGRFSSGEYAIGRVQKIPVLHFAYPIKDASGTITDIAVVVFNLENYAQHFNSKIIPANTSLFLADHKGTTLFNLTAPEFVGKQDRDDLFRRMAEGPDSGTFEADSNTGTRRYFAYQKLRLNGEQTPYMYVRVGLPVEAVLAKTSTKLFSEIGLMSTLLLLATGFASYISKRGIVDKVMALRAATQRIAQGDLAVRVTDHVCGGELGELGQAFEGMAAELARREEALLKSEERFRSYVENATDIVFSLSPDGVLTYVSPNWTAASGYELAETIGKSFTPFVHPDDVAVCFAFLRLVLESGNQQRDVEFRVRNKDGSWVWYAANGSSFQDPDSHELSFLGIARDISRQKQAEEALRESEAKYRLLVETANEGIWVVDKENRTTFVNHRVAEIFGYRPEEMLGRTVDSFVAHADAEHYAEQMNLRRRGNSSRFVRRFHRKDGSIVYLLVSATPQQDAQGEYSGSFAMLNDVTDLKQAEEELSRAKAAAEAASFAKSRFLANMSHEIRTPMNGVLGLTELLLQTELTDEQRRYAELVELSGKNMVQLLSDILDLSKIETQKIELESRDFDLISEINGTINLLALRAREKGLDLSSRIDPDVPLALKGDAGRLRQILTNLIGNAVKFTDKGSVSLRVRKDAEDDVHATLSFVVRDSGIGIAADKLEAIFEPFTQADISSTRKYSGSGLGLSISRQLAELMGGSIGVESVEGEGTTFHFAVVVEKQTVVAPPADGARPAAARTVSSTPAKTTKSGIRILLAEDDMINQLLIKTILSKHGYQVDMANNGAEALKLLEENDYAVVLMDCMMPVLNGYEATAVIRDPTSKVRNHAVPVIALTGNAMRGDRDICLAAGMDNYLSKPFNMAKLLELLDAYAPLDSLADNA